LMNRPGFENYRQEFEQYEQKRRQTGG